MDKQPKEWCNNHWGRAEVIIASFLMVIYPLKYPSNACLSCLENYSCWNVIYIECHRCLSTKQVYHCLSIGYYVHSRLYTVLETWGMLHNHWGCNPRWLYGIPKVSINSVEPRIHAITDLDYSRLAFSSNKTCVRIDISRYILF